MFFQAVSCGSLGRSPRPLVGCGEASGDTHFPWYPSSLDALSVPTVQLVSALTAPQFLNILDTRVRIYVVREEGARTRMIFTGAWNLKLRHWSRAIIELRDTAENFDMYRILRINHSRSSKVTEFSTNRQHVCDFLLACHSKHGPILHRFLPLFCPNFGGVPVAPDRPCWGSTWAGTLSYNIIIINKELIIVTLSQLNTVTGALILYSAEKLFLKYSKVQTMWSRYLNATVRRSDRQTTYCGITAICVATKLVWVYKFTR